MENYLLIFNTNVTLMYEKHVSKNELIRKQHAGTKNIENLLFSQIKQIRNDNVT